MDFFQGFQLILKTRQYGQMFQGTLLISYKTDNIDIGFKVSY